MISGPLLIVAEMLLNRVSYTGEDIVDKDLDSAGEKAAKTSAYLWRATMPNAPWVPGSWNFNLLKRAIIGETDVFGREYSITTAILRQFGPKLRPYDVDSELAYRIMKIDKQAKLYRQRLFKLQYDYSRKRISEGAYKRGEEQVHKRLGELTDELSRVVGTSKD